MGIIQKHLVILSENVASTIGDVLFHLVHQRIISVDERDEIQLPKNTKFAQGTELWLLLLKKDLDNNQDLLDILRRTNNEYCADIIEGKISEPLLNKQIRKSFPDKWWPEEKKLVNSFCERKLENKLIVEHLREILLNSDNHNGENICHMVALCGLGGLGKTTMATWFAHHYSSEYEHIIWINCEGKCLQESFRDLSRKLKIEGWKDETFTHLPAKCYKTLAYLHCLFVFDNAECFGGPNGIQSSLPGHNTNWHTIITTRSTEWGNLTGYGCITLYPMKVFNEMESVAFLKKNLKQKNYTPCELEQLPRWLGYLPLAMQIAVSLVNQQKLTIGEFVERILKTHVLIESDVVDDYQKTVQQSLSISLEQVKNEERNGEFLGELLTTFCFLESDNIPMMLFNAVHGASKCELLIAFESLQEYSLVEMKTQNLYGKTINMLSMHRVLQQVIRKQCSIDKGTNMLKKIILAPGYLQHKRVPLFYARPFKELTGDIELMQNYVNGKKRVKELLKEKKYEEATMFSMHEYMDCESNRKMIWKYNYGYCLKKLGKYEESLRVFDEIYIKLNLWNPQVCTSYNLDRFDKHKTIQRHYKEFIGVKCAKLCMKLGRLCEAVDYFDQIVHNFKRYYSNPSFSILVNGMYTLFSLMIKTGCQLSSILAKGSDFTKVVHVLTLTESLLEGPITNFSFWNEFKKGVESILFIKELNTSVCQLLFNSQKYINFDEGYDEEFQNFGKEIFASKEPNPGILQLIASMRVQAYGIKDSMSSIVCNQDTERVKILEESKTIDWVGSQSVLPYQKCSVLLCNYKFSNLLTNLSITYFEIVRSDLAYTLKVCTNLRFIFLSNVTVLGKCVDRIHLPNIEMYTLSMNNVYRNTRMTKTLELYKFFYKLDPGKGFCSDWMDIINMKEFHILDQWNSLCANTERKILHCTFQEIIFPGFLNFFQTIRLYNSYLPYFEGFHNVTSLRLADTTFINYENQVLANVNICQYFGDTLLDLKLKGCNFVVDLTSLKYIKTLDLSYCRLNVDGDLTNPLNLESVSLRGIWFMKDDSIISQFDLNSIFGNFTGIKDLQLCGSNISIDLTVVNGVNSIGLYSVNVVNCDKFLANGFTIELLEIQNVTFRLADGTMTYEPSFLYIWDIRQLSLNYDFDRRVPLNIDLTKLPKKLQRLYIRNANLKNVDTKLNFPYLYSLSLNVGHYFEIPNLLECSQLADMTVSIEHLNCDNNCVNGSCKRLFGTVNLNTIPLTVKRINLKSIKIINEDGNEQLDLERLVLRGYSYEDIDNYLALISRASELIVCTQINSLFGYKWSEGESTWIPKIIVNVMTKSPLVTIGEFNWETYENEEIDHFGLSKYGINEMHSYYRIERSGKWTGINVNEDDL